MKESGDSQLARISLVLGVVSAVVAAVVIFTFWFHAVYPLAHLGLIVVPPVSIVALVLGVIALVQKRGRSISALVGALLGGAVIAVIVYLIDIGVSSR